MLRAKDAVRVRVADELLRVLVRIPIDENGFLMNEQDAWKIGQRNEAGEGIEGIHNISLSYEHPGCLWSE